MLICSLILLSSLFAASQARGENLRVHFKQCREIAHTIRGWTATKAKAFLEDVINHKQAVPFRRYTGGTSRHAQVRPSALHCFFLSPLPSSHFPHPVACDFTHMYFAGLVHSRCRPPCTQQPPQYIASANDIPHPPRVPRLCVYIPLSLPSLQGKALKAPGNCVRWPEKAAKIYLDILRNAVANAEVRACVCVCV